MKFSREERIHEIVEKFKPFNMYVNIELVERAARALVLAKSDEARIIFQNKLNLFQNKIDLLKLKTSKPFIEVPSQNTQTGPLFLGNYMQGGNLYNGCMLEIDDLCNTSINAGVGKGKTNTFFHICKEVHKYSQTVDKERRLGLIIPERVKKDFRNMDIPAVVLDIKDLKINFFCPPPNVPDDKWIPEICNALMHVWGWMYASRNYFTMIDKLYQQYQKIPTFDEVYHEIKNDKESYGMKTRRQSEIQEINLDRIEQTIRSYGQCLSTRRTFQLHEFMTERINLVIEADVAPDSFAILLNWLLLYVYMHNKYNNIRGNISNGGTLLVFDEAYVIWDMIKNYSSERRELGADFISLAPLYLRDFRAAILAGSQRPLSPDFQASVNLHAIGYSGDYKDSQYYANSLGNPELLQVIMKLDRGEFLIKNGDKPAALIKIPLVPFRRKADEEISDMMKEYRDAIVDYCRDEEPEKDKREIPVISQATRSFLFDILDYPDSQLKERYDRLHLKDSSQQSALIEVLKSGYIALVKDTLHSKKQSKYLVATQKGIEWLRSQGKDCSAIENRGNMSPAHSLYQTTLFLRLRSLGLEVSKEKDIGQKKVDVATGKIGFEIAVGQDVDVSRVMSALPELENYFFLCQSVIVEQSIRSRVPKDEKIKFRMASDFLLSLLDSESDNSRSICKYHQTTPNNQNSQTSNPNRHDQPKHRSSD